MRQSALDAEIAKSEPVVAVIESESKARGSPSPAPTTAATPPVAAKVDNGEVCTYVCMYVCDSPHCIE